MGRKAPFLYLAGAVLAFVLALITGGSLWLIPTRYVSLCTIEALPEFDTPIRAACDHAKARSGVTVELKHLSPGGGRDIFFLKVRTRDREESRNIFEQILDESQARAPGNPHRALIRKEIRAMPSQGEAGASYSVLAAPLCMIFIALCIVLFVLAFAAHQSAQTAPPPLPDQAAKFDEY